MRDRLALGSEARQRVTYWRREGGHEAAEEGVDDDDDDDEDEDEDEDEVEEEGAMVDNVALTAVGGVIIEVEGAAEVATTPGVVEDDVCR